MSRSRKKTWGVCDRCPYAKRQANKKVRRTPGISSGGSYKKVYDPWNICDFKFLYFNKNNVSEYHKNEMWKVYAK